MRVAFGIKAHSGWAALVALGTRGGVVQVVERHRMELVEPGDASWAKQPYHAARGAKAGDAREIVARGVVAARRVAARELRAAVERARSAGHDVAACAVLMADPMPDWTVEAILAVHVRMHKAEGVLFRDALVRAAGTCGVPLLGIPERQLDEQAEQSLEMPASHLRKMIASLGKTVGPPWAEDQKDAALAAMMALQGRPL